MYYLWELMYKYYYKYGLFKLIWILVLTDFRWMLDQRLPRSRDVLVIEIVV